MMSSDRPETAIQRGTVVRLISILVLCAPAIVAATGLSTLTVLARHRSPGGSLNALEYLLGASAVLLFLMGEIGPLFLIGAAPLVSGFGRRVGPKSWMGRLAWVTLTLGLIATAVFYRWLYWAVELP